MEKYRPKHYKNPSTPDFDSEKDSELFAGKNPIEKEQVEIEVKEETGEEGKEATVIKEQIPFKTLVVRSKRDKILKFLMRQDSFSKELQ